MIINYFFSVLVDIVGSIFAIVPTISTLPTIGGYDIDSALVQGVGYLRGIMPAFWFLEIMFQGFLALMIYYIIKMALRFLIGHRTPQ